MDEREKGFECLPAEREKSISRAAFFFAPPQAGDRLTQ